MIKKILVIAFSFIACSTFVHAQESWGDGLSDLKCEWMSVKPAFVKTKDGDKTTMREAWIKCSEEKCTHKFCSKQQSSLKEGESLQPDATGFWERDMCNKYCITLQEQLPIEGHNVRSISGDSGVDLLGNYFGLWYKIGALVLGLICVLVIVISGVQIIFGGVSEESVTSAKTRIWGALLSLILLFSSALILRTINPLFFT